MKRLVGAAVLCAALGFGAVMVLGDKPDPAPVQVSAPEVVQAPASPEPIFFSEPPAAATPAPTSPRTAVPKPDRTTLTEPQVEPPAVTFIPDGQYAVGTDIPAGVYVARGGTGCRVDVRHFDTITTRALEAPMRVDLASGDYLISSGCGGWNSIAS